MYRLSLFTLLGFLTLLSGCGGERMNDPVVATTETLDFVLTEVVDNSVVPAVENFYEQSVALKVSSTAFCDQPTLTNLEAVRQEWRDVFSSWYRLSNYNFGPLNDNPVFPAYIFIDSLRLRGTDYTDTLQADISNNLVNDIVLDDAYFASLTFQRMGLLALELVAFETASDDHSRDVNDILLEYQNTPRKCDMLLGYATQIEARMTDVVNEWNVSYSGSTDSYRTVFLNAELSDGTAPITLLIVSVQEFIDYLRSRDVVSTAAQASDYSWQAISASIDEIEELLVGTEETTVSLVDLMVGTGNDVAVSTVMENIASARVAIEQEDTVLLEVALSVLDGNFKREIPDSLEVDLGFNFTDGD